MRILDCGNKKRSFDLVALHPRGQVVAAAGCQQETVVWDTVSGAARLWLEPAGSLEFHPLDGRLFLSTGPRLQACDTNSGAIEVVIPEGPFFGMPCFAPNGSWAVYQHRPSGPNAILTAVTRFAEPDQTTLWNVGHGDTADESGNSTSLACLPDGKRFMSEEWVSKSEFEDLRRRLAIRSRADGSLLQSVVFDESSYGGVVLGSPWSDAVVIKERACFWVVRCDDLHAPMRLIKNDNKKHFTGIAFHPSGRYLAATSNDATVKLYDTTSWEVAKTFTWNIGKMRSIAFSPDGTLAAAGSDTGKVVVWDVDL